MITPPPNGSKTIKQGSTMNKKVDTHYGLMSTLCYSLAFMTLQI